MLQEKKKRNRLVCMSCQQKPSMSNRPHGWLCVDCDNQLSWNGLTPFAEVMAALKRKVDVAHS